jgi:hypothetical protein
MTDQPLVQHLYAVDHEVAGARLTAVLGFGLASGLRREHQAGCVLFGAARE